MYGAGENLLAGSRLSGKQHRGVCDAHLFSESDRRAQFFGRADYRVERLVGSVFRRRPARPDAFRGAGKERQDFVGIVALCDVVESPVFHGLHAVGYVAESREKYDFRIRQKLFNFRHELDAVAVGQLDVANYYVGGRPPDLRHGRPARVGLRNFKALKGDHLRKKLAQLPLVVNYQHFFHCAHSRL